MSKRYVILLWNFNKGKNIHELSKEVNMTTSHLTNVTDQFQREGIIYKKKIGREMSVNLTEKGKELVQLLSKYDDLFNKKLNLETKNDRN